MTACLNRVLLHRKYTDNSMEDSVTSKLHVIIVFNTQIIATLAISSPPNAKNTLMLVSC